MAEEFSISELEAYLDEALPPEEMLRIEKALRDSKELVRRLSQINGRRDAGIHTLGEIWRRNRLSCPPRNQLAGLLLNTLDEENRDYIEFHLKVVGCRFCIANLADLKRQHAESEDVRVRRKKYFDSSAGLLHDSE